MYLKKTERNSVDWIQLVLDKFQWQAFCDHSDKHTWKAGNLFTNWATVRLLGRALLCVVIFNIKYQIEEAIALYVSQIWSKEGDITVKHEWNNKNTQISVTLVSNYQYYNS
jgi:hypothetical protein